MSNRIDRCFELCRQEDRRALVMFVSAGDPNLAFTERLIPELVAAGADIIELGVPFSDPMADGPTIQAASERALKSGTRLGAILEMVGRLRARGVAAPFVLFGYYNVFLRYGIEKLAAACADQGIDGCLIVDVPYEEEAEVRPVLDTKGIHKITLLAPTTPVERMGMLTAHATGFVYYITVTGVTGARSDLPADLADHLRQVKAVSPIPVVAGFGVSDPETARRIAKYVDGVVVGSKLVQTIADAPDEETALAAASQLVTELSSAMR